MTDHEIGRVVKALQTAGMTDDTLLIFTSDNGPVWYAEDVERRKRSRYAVISALHQHGYHPIRNRTYDPMSKFAVVDHATHNILGEYPSEGQAEELRARLVEADPSVERDLQIHSIEEAHAPELADVVSVERV
jgi:hypothetical protein